MKTFNQEEVITICSNALKILSNMDCESSVNHSEHPLIFPQKNDGNKRISEQELRVLFIDELKKYKDLYFSIETPTRKRYNFSGDEIEDLRVQSDFIESNLNFQSASTDLTLFKKGSDKYKRTLNIEFKYQTERKSIAKDILKLVAENESGAFIQLINNSNRGTYPSLLRKFHDSLYEFREIWETKNKDKFVLIVILNITRRSINYKYISYKDLNTNDLESIFINNFYLENDIISGWEYLRV